jgi:hypothetical protein
MVHTNGAAAHRNGPRRTVDVLTSRHAIAIGPTPPGTGAADCGEYARN